MLFSQYCKVPKLVEATLFRDDIKEAFGLTDSSEIPGDDTEDIELEVTGDDGAWDMELDDKEEDEEDDDTFEDLESEDDNPVDEEEGDDEEEDTDGELDDLGYGDF